MDSQSGGIVRLGYELDEGIAGGVVVVPQWIIKSRKVSATRDLSMEKGTIGRAIYADKKARL